MLSIIDNDDATPPAAIADLTLSARTQTTIDLSWTAPGDDGTTGTAMAYDMRYATVRLNAANWSAATPVDGEPAPMLAGSLQNMTVSNLYATGHILLPSRALMRPAIFRPYPSRRQKRRRATSSQSIPKLYPSPKLLFPTTTVHLPLPAHRLRSALLMCRSIRQLCRRD